MKITYETEIEETEENKEKEEFVLQKETYNNTTLLTWLGCNNLDPVSFLLFSNWEWILVMCPKAPMNETLETTCKKSINVILASTKTKESRARKKMRKQTDLGHTFHFHIELLDIPVTSRYGPFKAMSNPICVYFLKGRNNK